jgi:Zn-dependent M28 family amino/carboxypeptidase
MSDRRPIVTSATASAAAILALLVGAACASAQTGAATPGFDGARAHDHIRQLVAIGPRVAGTPGAEKARDYITAQLKGFGLTVEEQPFEARTPAGPTKMVNLRVTLPGAAALRRGSEQAGSGHDRLIIAGHYDTKQFREFTFVGANDGGSSAAFLIEMARVLKDRKNALPIELLFLDGEEAVVDWNTGNDNTYGSRYYVEAARQAGTLPQIRALVLVDMIGDRDLRISRESNSTAWLTDIIWGAAKTLKRREFLERETPIEDDHLRFLEAGVPAVDIIDLDYPAWHTAGDTLDKVSAASLQAVGEVLLAALPEIEKRLAMQP